jgi:uncharacterized membrane protein
MKITGRSLIIIASLLCATSLPAQAARVYRLVPIGNGNHPLANGEISISDLNGRSEVVGSYSFGGDRHAFRWRAGTLTDLHSTVDPAASDTQATGINDLSTIVGDKYTGESTQGFVLRGTQVTPLQVAGGDQVFPLDINNRGQIIVDSYGGTEFGSFLVDGDRVRHLDGLPGGDGSMNAHAINDRGVVAGSAQSSEGVHAVLWQGGTTQDLGVPPGGNVSVAFALNNRLEVVGITNISGLSHGFVWRNGAMKLLRHLPQATSSSAEDINNWGAIVGGQTTSTPVYRNMATLWFAGHVVELDSLVCPKDPLKPYVHLESASQINDRGDIVAIGIDSRRPNARFQYFLTLVGQ